MRVRVDREKCDGLGVCESVAPAVFELGGDGVIVVINDKPPDSALPDVQAAVDSCPTGALSIE